MKGNLNMATYNANGVDIDGITSKGGMIDAINTYKSALQKSLNTVSKTHANTTLMNNAMKGAGVEEAYKAAETALKKNVNAIISRLDKATEFLKSQLKEAYNSEASTAVKNAFNIK